MNDSCEELSGHTDSEPPLILYFSLSSRPDDLDESDFVHKHRGLRAVIDWLFSDKKGGIYAMFHEMGCPYDKNHYIDIWLYQHSIETINKLKKRILELGLGLVIKEQKLDEDKLSIIVKNPDSE